MSVAMAKVRSNRLNRSKDQYSDFCKVCTEANRDQIIFSINKMGAKHVDNIIESFVCNLIGLAFVNKSQEELLELIKGGSLFSIHKQLEESFRNDPAISEAIQALKGCGQPSSL